MTVRIDRGGHTATVTFPYDAEAVETIKTIAGRRWDADRKHWTIGTTSVQLAAKRFTDAGFLVTVEGHAYTATPATMTNGTRPIADLFAALPPPLRPDAYKALARVLHPDVGGDTVLMQQLNDAYEECER